MFTVSLPDLKFYCFSDVHVDRIQMRRTQGCRATVSRISPCILRKSECGDHRARQLSHDMTRMKNTSEYQLENSSLTSTCTFLPADFSSQHNLFEVQELLFNFPLLVLAWFQNILTTASVSFWSLKQAWFAGGLLCQSWGGWRPLATLRCTVRGFELF